MELTTDPVTGALGFRFLASECEAMSEGESTSYTDVDGLGSDSCTSAQRDSESSLYLDLDSLWRQERQECYFVAIDLGKAQQSEKPEGSAGGVGLHGAAPSSGAQLVDV